MDPTMMAYLAYVANNPLERRAMEIAKDHLGSSFDIGRSNGFRTWCQQQQQQQQQQQKQTQVQPQATQTQPHPIKKEPSLKCSVP